MFLPLLTISGLLSLWVVTSDGQRIMNIAAFKVEVFGKSKASEVEVMKVLADTIRRYDVILIQDIRDISEQAIHQLLDQVNQGGHLQYNMTLSGRLGRTSSKAQYAFFYKEKGHLTLAETFQYPDSGDVFEREPYAVLFTTRWRRMREIALVGIQVKPSDAVAELQALPAVMDEVKSHWNIDDILLLGNFDADCSYISQSELDNLVLRDNTMYKWWIPDDADTTTSISTDCAYDRFVMTGGTFINRVVPNSTRVFLFDQEYGLSNSEALAVSDHYPIEMTICFSD